MQLLVRQPVPFGSFPFHERDLPAPSTTTTPHGQPSLTFKVSKSSDGRPSELCNNQRSAFDQSWPALHLGGTGVFHGRVNATSHNTEEVKTLDMTTDASLPPPAPVTVPATNNNNNIINTPVDVNGHRDSSGEVNARHMSYPNLTLQETCADIYERVSRFLDAEPANESIRRTQEQSRIALDVIQEALQRYEFGTLSLSYNGGKDCLVLLILYLAGLHAHYNGSTPLTSSNDQHTKSSTSKGSFPTSIPSIYAKPPDPFPEVTSFVETSTAAYHLSLTHISTNPGSDPKNKSHTSPPTTHAVPVTNGITSATTTTTTAQATSSSWPAEKSIITFRDAFEIYLDANPKIEAIFVGTRRTDPHGGKLTHFDMTDGNWPRFTRIHPVIDWQLSDVWTFLRHPALADPKTGQMLEYCSIYDMGYTSLGGVGDTLRNPKLKYRDQQGHEKYRPAYEMTEDLGERLGRE